MCCKHANQSIDVIKKNSTSMQVFSRFIGLNGPLDWQRLIVIGTSRESANSHFDTHC